MQESSSQKKISSKTLVVIGGGAAGFFCAVNAARLHPGLNVIILEKTGKVLSKVKVSGGGRCNVTHACFDIREMSENYPRGKNFVKKTFHQFFTTDTITWFEERDVILKTEDDGRMFPVTDSSQTIIDCLLLEASQYNVDLRLNVEVKKLEKNGDRFMIHLANNKHLQSDFVCVASGGYSKAEMFNWLTDLGHTIAEPVPSLFTFNLPAGKAGPSKHPITALMGISVENTRVKIEGTKLVEEGPLLITHWGLSGPVILKLSAWGARELHKMNYHFKVHINWMPAENDQTLKAMIQGLRIGSPAKKMINLNFSHLPARLWEFFLVQSSIDPEKRLSELPAKQENQLIKTLVDYIAEVRGKTTFKEEFVTAGGILLSEVDANTMMSKKVPGLFFAGEILDVDGITGGFNFQHAWTSGFVAAKGVGSRET